MPQHYTQNTVEDSIFCNRCRKMTPWRILNGKRAFCIPCHEKRTPTPPKPPTPPASTQGDLF